MDENVQKKLKSLSFWNNYLLRNTNAIFSSKFEFWKFKFRKIGKFHRLWLPRKLKGFPSKCLISKSKIWLSVSFSVTSLCASCPSVGRTSLISVKGGQEVTLTEYGLFLSISIILIAITWSWRQIVVNDCTIPVQTI